MDLASFWLSWPSGLPSPLELELSLVGSTFQEMRVGRLQAKDCLMVSGSVIDFQGAQCQSQERLGGARRSQEEPGEPGGARRSQEEPASPNPEGRRGRPRVGQKARRGGGEAPPPNQLCLRSPGLFLAPPGSSWLILAPHGSSWLPWSFWPSFIFLLALGSLEFYQGGPCGSLHVG